MDFKRPGAIELRRNKRCKNDRFVRPHGCVHGGVGKQETTSFGRLAGRGGCSAAKIADASLFTDNLREISATGVGKSVLKAGLQCSKSIY